ncbi:hypothetical protein HNR43_002009 [Anoxybacillus mongoliensis]|uniref:Uncharacterized protein n=1 Tax=Anoxybacillus mongoliensis TaxID=452565 RepID=A0A7W8JFB7_9BACL|nr:hypothetical protein [Anoxybacillus mongoliensis]MBB5356029.1 hypothetical protein [Anoxybacillus mongoliensis]
MKKVEHLKMTKSVIEDRLRNALRRLYYYDQALIYDDVHERSIAHRLAVHMSTVFYEWDVDVEYNRDCGDVKRIYDNSESRGKPVFPDIIVHKRGTEENLLVIEIKKWFSSSRFDAGDLEKIRMYLLSPTLQYRYGAFVKLGWSLEDVRFVVCTKGQIDNLLCQFQST